MEANFCYNLALEEFARLSHRSLSTFKRDFRKHYNQSPGKWLLQKRLEYSAVLLKNPALNVSQVALDCGFEDLSHFSRAFKEKFGRSPANYRKQVSSSAFRVNPGRETDLQAAQKDPEARRAKIDKRRRTPVR
jgi:AraC-like DNA-binding protein